MSFLIDFHSHIKTPNAIYCTAFPSLGGSACNSCCDSPLMHCEGLLPQYWNEERFRSLLEILKEPNIQLGEVGIDKRFVKLIPLEKQYSNLVIMLQYAKKYGKKVVIHSVQATEITIKAIQQASLEPFNILWHNFTGSKETAKLLNKLGVVISISPRFKSDLKAICEANPAWGLETDFEGKDILQYNKILKTLYSTVAEQLSLTVDKVREHCNGQAEAFTNKPIPW